MPTGTWTGCGTAWRRTWRRSWGLRTAEDRARWLADRFGARYPADAADAEAVHDIMTGAALRVRRTVYECESCGRLWLQARPDGPRFCGYAPEAPGTSALRPVARTEDGAADGHPHQTRREGHG